MRIPTIALPLLLTASLATACSSDTSGAPPCDDPVEVTTVTMGEFYYEPACAQASNGDTLEVVNEGDVVHTWTIRDSEPRVEANLEAGDSGEVTIEGLNPGTVYQIYCIYHSNMTGAFKAI